jgi:hypothetical protein
MDFAGTGAVLPVVMIFFAIYFWRRLKELPIAGDLVFTSRSVQPIETAAFV